jgi:predicted N-acetyltransferase YhbS
VRVRVATQLDERGVLDVLRADGEATGRQPSKARLAAVRATLRSPGTLTLVADADATVVGALVAELTRPVGGGPAEAGMLHLTLLCVAPASRRRGAGRALVRGLLERFDRVTTSLSDEAVRALLVQEGFVRTGASGAADTDELRHAPG